MPVLIGSLGLGAEVASWYGGKRGLQNAADSAAIAAATNGTAGGYDDEARAVAAQYGFHDGVDGVTVAASDTAPCPGVAGSSECYSVVISRTQPLFLAQIVGFAGDTTVDGSPAKIISAKAVAIQAMGPRDYCILALAGSGKQQSLRTNGAPFANLTGCNVMSNTDAVCNGHDLNADVGDAHGVNNGCGKMKNSGVPTVADPYAGLASKIPPDPCGSYPPAPKKKKDQQLPPENIMSGPMPDLLIPRCGDVQLDGPTFINSGGNTVLVIYNGTLDLKGYTLETQAGSSLTIIFAGGDQSRAHTPIGNGTLDIRAPTTGDWKGVALYQAPNLTSSTAVDISEAGNQPNWKITGLGYFPHASVTFSGAVSKATGGAKCFGMVVDNLTINGTGSILDSGECAQAGLELPKGLAPARGELVS